ncbi:hypothetical protein C4572_01240 [Candidatus Parcubacteria bacterium]|nr:MAG: hypothetical protein C4572_01240 [Candidatus Parcubacteria bacterium]
MKYLAIILILVAIAGIGFLVYLSLAATRGMAVDLYYYNQSADFQEGGGVGCSPDAVLPVSRMMRRSNEPIKDTIGLLLKGELTEEEIDRGFSTEFPGEGFALAEARKEDGLLVLRFEDPNNFTTGGSCRVRILWAQIEKTAKQFPGVSEVRFEPEWLFQP